MKRWIYLIMLMAYVVAVTVACGGESPAEPAEPDQGQPPAVEEPTEEEAELPPPVITEQEGSLKVTYLSARVRPNRNSLPPKSLARRSPLRKSPKRRQNR